MIHSRKTGKRWATAIDTKLWDVAWDLWENHKNILHSLENMAENSSLDGRV
jgi:hypothetical protein